MKTNSKLAISINHVQQPESLFNAAAYVARILRGSPNIILEKVYKRAKWGQKTGTRRKRRKREKTGTGENRDRQIIRRKGNRRHWPGAVGKALGAGIGIDRKGLLDQGVRF